MARLELHRLPTIPNDMMRPAHFQRYLNNCPEVTDREREILTLIAQGKNNQAIARHLSLSVKTVANHVSSIFSTLQVADRSEAIIRAPRRWSDIARGRYDLPIRLVQPERA